MPKKIDLKLRKLPVFKTISGNRFNKKIVRVILKFLDKYCLDEIENGDLGIARYKGYLLEHFETTRIAHKGVALVFVGEDLCPEFLKKDIISLCRENDIPLVMVQTSFFLPTSRRMAPLRPPRYFGVFNVNFQDRFLLQRILEYVRDASENELSTGQQQISQ